MSPIHTLPPELNLKVVSLLPLSDRLSFSLVSRTVRQLVLPFIFGTFTFHKRGFTAEALLEGLTKTGSDIKSSVK
jgi:hypothetical protein